MIVERAPERGVTPIKPRHKRVDEAAGALARSAFLGGTSGTLAAFGVASLQSDAGIVALVGAIWAAISALAFLGWSIALFALGLLWLLSALFPGPDPDAQARSGLWKRIKSLPAFIAIVIAMPFELILVAAAFLAAQRIIALLPVF